MVGLSLPDSVACLNLCQLPCRQLHHSACGQYQGAPSTRHRSHSQLGSSWLLQIRRLFLSSANTILGTEWPILGIILPIGISFFTFTQIAFLADAYAGKVTEYRFIYYVLFVTYFPHLIAGPVLHHKEMMPQFDEDRNYRPNASNFAIGLTIFAIGLAKKVLIADNLAGYAAPVFSPQADTPSLFRVGWRIGIYVSTLL